jgi:hypothetical protein
MPDELLRAAIGMHLGSLTDRLFTRASLERLAAELVDLLGVGVSVAEVTAHRREEHGTVRMRVEAGDDVARVLEDVFRQLVPVGVRFEVEGIEQERDDLVYANGRQPSGRVERRVPGLAEIASRLQSGGGARSWREVGERFNEGFAAGLRGDDRRFPAATFAGIDLMSTFTRRDREDRMDAMIAAAAALDAEQPKPAKKTRPKPEPKRVEVNRLDLINGDLEFDPSVTMMNVTVAPATSSSAREAWADSLDCHDR